jgi:hypothetical protein
MTDFIGGNVKNNKLVQAMILLGALTAAANSYAMEGNGIEYTGSGFATIGIGKMLGGTRGNVADYNCPCFAADYAQAGVYDGRSGLQLKPDSKIGVQGSASFDNRRYSVTAQVVARGADKGNVGLEWLYGGYKLNDKITIQAGRKRLPMFYYSDAQDIGVALPWAHLPPQLYGWEVVNYNGVNMMYQDQWKDWSATVNLLAGNETKKESGYWKIYNGRQNRTDSKWSNIVGGDLTLSKDWLETRFVYIQSDTQTKNVNGMWDTALQAYDPAFIQTDFGPTTQQKIYGLTVNVDYENWLARTEIIHINRPGATWKDFAQIVAAGYRMGKWQPMLTWSNYRGVAVISMGGDPDGQEAHATTSLTLRYDLSTSSDLKVQYDSQKDKSGPNWIVPWTGGTPYGDARLLTFVYDMVF